MKKLLFICIMLSILHHLSYSQYSSYQIKEHYDSIIDRIVIPDTFNHLEVDGDNGDYLGDRVSYVLLSFLRMYYLTGDKAYLIRFISWSYKIQMIRNDLASSLNHAGWANPWNSGVDPGCMYQDGLIIMPMAEFVYYVDTINEQLSSTSLPSSSDLGLDHDNLFPPTAIAKTYGEYAEWLSQKLDNTLAFYFWEGFYDDDYGFTQYQNEDNAGFMNFQSPFAVSLYYKGILDPNYYYSEAAVNIANRYLGYTKCDNYQHPVFWDWLSNQSFCWHHNGWRNMGYNYPCSYTEDISHAVMDFFFPQTLFKYEEYPFVLDHMIAWHNTFTLNVYDGYGNFHNGVSGNDDDISPGNANYHLLNDLKMRSLAWMPFYNFDQYCDPPRIYEDIVMPFYTANVYTGIDLIKLGMGYMGLSDVVTAQWDKEDVNLTLYGRKVVYHQDFSADNTLIVGPQRTSDAFYNEKPYADPRISTNQFTIEPEIEVNMQAGVSILLQPGFFAKEGCHFIASINPPESSGNYGNNFSKNNNVNDMLSNDLISNENKIANSVISNTVNDGNNQQHNYLQVNPNPFSETTNIQISIKAARGLTLIITDQFGIEVAREVFIPQFEGSIYNYQFSSSKLFKGIFFCILYNDGQIIQTKKIVLNK